MQRRATSHLQEILENALPILRENRLRMELHAAPTLFLHGENDPLVDPAGSLAAVQVMPRAELVLVGQCGHWLPIEAPEIFCSEVTAFLRRLR